MSTLTATPADFVGASPLPSRPTPLFDLVLRDPSRLSAMLSNEDQLPRATQKLLALSLLGLVIFGAVVGESITAVPLDELAWLRHGTPVLWMPAAFAMAFV